MNIQFLYENGKGFVVDEYGRPEPMWGIGCSYGCC